MKSLSRFILLFAICCFFIAPSLSAQEMSEEQMKIWQDYMSPGEVHGMLAKSVGEWKTESKMWMSPGSEPTLSKGKAVSEMILGGRYLASKHTSSIMGMPFEGQMLLGFDNMTKEFTNVWVDNMGTGLMIGKGKWDEATKSVTFTGTMADPMLGKMVDFKEIMTIIDDNHHKLEVFSPGPDGKEYKWMELTYSR